MRAVVLALLVFIASISQATETSEGLSKKQQNSMIRKASDLITSYSGDQKVLQDAKVLLDQIIEVNPKSAQAHTLLAMQILLSGYINGGHNYKPYTVINASKEVDLAIAANPKYAFAYMVKGDIEFAPPLSFFSQQLAIDAYKKAEDLGYDKYQICLRMTRVYIEGDAWELAEQQLKKYESYANSNKINNNDQRTLLSLQKTFYGHKGDLANVDKAYRGLIKINPESAWTHGNYASFLVFDMGKPDEAISEAQTALKLMDYGMAHAVLGVAQFCKWAELRKTDPTKAKSYLDAAKGNIPDINWLATKTFAAYGNNKAMQELSEALLENKIPIDVKDQDGDTALNMTQSVKSVEWLITHGANPNIVDSRKHTPIYYAARFNNPDLIKTLSKHGVDVNQHSESDNPPIFTAAFWGSSDAVSALLNLGVKPDLTFNGTCETPLLMAANRGNGKVLKILLDAGANPEQICINPRLPNEPKTAIEYAVRSNQQEAVDILRDSIRRKRLTSLPTSVSTNQIDNVEPLDAWTNTESRKTQNGFSAWALVTTDLDWDQQWNSPQAPTRYFKEVKSFRVGEKVAIITFLANPKTDDHKNASVFCDIKYTDPNNKITVLSQHQPCAKVESQERHKNIRLGTVASVFSGDKTDPPGKYTYEITITDALRNTTLQLKTDLVLDPAASESKANSIPVSKVSVGTTQ